MHVSCFRGKKTFILIVAGTAVLAGCSNMPDMGAAREAYEAEDYKLAFSQYEELAAFGIPRAKVELGKLYYYGRGTNSDPAKALRLFEEAAAEGEASSAEPYIPRTQAKLGSMILKDKVDGYKKEQAIALLKDAARQGNRNALFDLGYAYEYGLGVPQSGPIAARHYQLAAEKGYARADSYRGRLYAKGELVPKNIPLALALYEKAAAGGYPRAYLALGQLYEKGRDVQQDYARAAEYYKLAQAGGETQDATAALNGLHQKIAGQPPTPLAARL